MYSVSTYSLCHHPQAVYLYIAIHFTVQMSNMNLYVYSLYCVA